MPDARDLSVLSARDLSVVSPTTAHSSSDMLMPELAGVKLSIPPWREGTVSRGELIGRAVAASRIVAVTAPAGYGKTTFLGEWARGEDRPVAWLSLDRSDDDPVALLGVVAAAVARSGLVAYFDIGELIRPGVSALTRAAPRLAAVLASASTPFVLMVDDFQEIRSAECHDVIDVLLSAVPSRSQFVAASRDEQLHVPLRRSRGEVFEIGPSELALDAVGARQIFGTLAIDLPDQAAEGLVERTEGWPAGIYLSALVAKQDPSAIFDVSGEDRFVSDYLQREVFSRMAADDQAFLLNTAILGPFTAHTCDAVCESRDSEGRLRRLEASNMFLVPLDHRRSWYRHHALFREFLMGQLRRTDPGRVDALHRRAARWYEDNGAPKLAMYHLFEAGDHDAAVQLVTKLGRLTYNTERAAVAHSWLVELGEERVAANVPLAVLSAWESAMFGDTAEALRWAELADRFDLDLDSSPASSFASPRVILRAAMCRNGVEEMMTDAAFAYSLEGPSGPWRVAAVWMLAEAHALNGDIARATVLFHEAVTTERHQNHPGPVVDSLTQLAWGAMERGEMGLAAEHIDRALEVIAPDGTHDSIYGLEAHAASARLRLHSADPEAARSVLARVMRGRAIATDALPTISVRLRLGMATTCIALGDPQTSRVLLGEIVEIMQHRPALGTLVSKVDDLHHALDLAAPAGPGATPLSPSELRVLPYLQTHLTFSEIGERLFVSGNTVRTQATSIYRKLGVSSRGDAVANARMMGLLVG